MEANNPTSESDLEPSAHDCLRALLRSRYGLTGEYVSAPTIALILGVGRTTVHDRVKSNSFVIPHRLIDRKPLFLLDDLVAWMLGRERQRSHEAAPAPGRPLPDPSAAEFVFAHAEARDAFLRVCERRGLSKQVKI